ncbi:MAG: hypothetical protein AAGA56_23645 [Myxococcota bacterium]
MRETFHALNRLLAPPEVDGVALVASDSTVFMSGLAFPAETLAELSGSARHLIRQTRPEFQLIDLSFDEGRLILVPAGAAVVWLSAHSSADASELVRGLEDELLRVNELDLCQSQVGPESERLEARAPESTTRYPSTRAPAPKDIERLVEEKCEPMQEFADVGESDVNVVLEAAARAVVSHVAATLGGPVIRNYLKRSQKALLGDYPWLASIDVSIAGELSFGSVLDAVERPGPAMGAWMKGFMERAGAIVPDIDRDLRGVVSEASVATLDRCGFF